MQLKKAKFTITGCENGQNNYYTGDGYFNYGGHLEKREAVVSSSHGVIGYRSRPSEPYVVGNLINHSDLTRKELWNLEKCTITLDFVDGKQLVLRSACTLEIEEEDNIISGRWAGQSLEFGSY